MERRSENDDERVGESRTLHRALDLLEHLARIGRPVALAEIAESAGVAKPTVHRLLATLQSRGYVSQDGRSGRYAVGIRCFELGSLWAQQLDLRAVAAPHLRLLNATTGETVHLAVYEYGDVVYVDKLESTHPVVARSYVGRRCPSYCVSTGRALLAFQPVEEIDRVLDGPLSAYTPETVTDPDALREILDEVRRCGYGVNYESYRPGVCGLAAPVRDHTGAVIASVGVCVPTPRFQAEDVPRLRDCTFAAADAISSEFGWHAARGVAAGDTSTT